MTEEAVLVTGAGSGIGRSCAELLAAEGYTVYAGMRKLQSSPFGPAAGGQIIPLAMDIASDDSVAAAATAIAQSGSQLRGLVNCAGVGLSGPLQYLESVELTTLFDVNVVGPMRVVRNCLPLLQPCAGKIIMIGSTSAYIPGVFTGAYSATKFALYAISAVLRAELANSGIAVSVIDPGMIGTPHWEKMLRQARALLLGRSDALADPHLDASFSDWAEKVGRMGESAEDAQPVARKVLQILQTAKPSFRHVVGRKAKLKLAVWQFLPQGLKERIIKRPLATGKQ
ncbi:SDR family NAD(P)-dependent oxidoreductase [Methyloterricola oryzae]|uniref:SDR family NAD(P)-dependent oxidoreductase n=1 Tax=Methyloterricola oryzae TaxID=1495050 RepID=UPI0005EBE687|nr:SDR family NAD(P)-dependent oxidoreductase [Methyloterricola oryzae]